MIKATNWAPELPARTAAARLYRWGYLRPDDLEAPEDLAEIDTYDDHRLSQAIHDYQDYFREDLDVRSTRTHGRPLIVDGQIGPVTQALLQEPRCGVADHVRGLEANWPTACREDLTFAPLFARLAPLSPEQTMSAFRAACASWGKDVQLQITLAQDLGQNAHIWARAAPLRGSTLAWSYLPQNSCAAHLEQRYNTAVNWSQTYLQGVGAHELGHAVGLQHSRDPRALMYPTARREIYLPHAVDIEAMLRLGYDRRTTDPEPEPPTPGVRVEGFIRINSWRYELRPARANGGGTDWT